MRGKLTRREFLHKGFLAALGAGLVSCVGPQRLAEITPVKPRDTVASPPAFTSTKRPTPTAEGASIPELHEARYYLQLEGNRVQCQICFRRCTVPEGGRGFCRNKINIGGRYYTFVYGLPILIRSLTRGPGLPPPWACDIRTSNGMLAEVNSHDFDTIRWLAKSEFERIHAEANTLKCFDLKEEFPDFYDNAIVSLRLKNGTLGIIEGSCPVDYGYDARAEVLGSEGVILIGELQDTAVVSCTKSTGLVASNFPGWRERFREAYIAEARHFVECIIKEEEPAVTGEDGKRALEGVLAANRSIETGRPVDLPFKGG